jgi:hypothetical protein
MAVTMHPHLSFYLQSRDDDFIQIQTDMTTIKRRYIKREYFPEKSNLNNLVHLTSLNKPFNVSTYENFFYLEAEYSRVPNAHVATAGY